MRKKLCTLLTIFTLTLASSITAFAAPEIMPDGGVFDAEYYAQNNPEVVVAFGTDKELLYSHYVNCGKAEGRLAVAPVELTKENPVTRTAKREQLRNDYSAGRSNSTGIYFYLNGKVKDKVGHSFDADDVDRYFSDTVIEQFNTFGDLVAFVNSIDLFKYAEENTWANYYYYHDLKTKVTEYALAHVNDGYFQYHYWTEENVVGTPEAGACLANLYRILEPYYGGYGCWQCASGMHILSRQDIFNFDADGYCIRMGMYKSKDLHSEYYSKWYTTEACKSGLK